jgi:hypothetical protein
MVERFHRQLKDALRARLVNQDWLSQLPWVLLGLRAAPKEDCGLSSAEMVFGEPLVLPWAVSQLLPTSSWFPGAAAAEHGEVRAAGGEAGIGGRAIQDGG